MQSHFTLILFVSSMVFFGETQSCSSVAPVSTLWPGGMTYESLFIPISSSTVNWTMHITFSQKISHLLAWNASVAKSNDNVTFPFANIHHNGAQSAGTVFSEVGFHVAYQKTDTFPVIKKILFNDEQICAGKTTTTEASTISSTRALTRENTDTTKSITAELTTSSASQTTTAGPTSSSTTTAVLTTPSTTSTTSTTASTMQSTTSGPTTTTTGSSSTSQTTTTGPTLSPTTTAGPTTSSSTSIQWSTTQSSTAGPSTTTTGSSSTSQTTTTGPTSSSTTTAVPTTPSSTPGTSTQSTTTRPTTTTFGSTTMTPLTTKYDYKEVLRKSLLFYYAQRSGPLPADDNPITFRNSSATNDVGQNGEDLTGGYFNDGGFVKSTFIMAATTTMVAWSIIDYSPGYVSAGQLTNAQNMVKWSTDYLIKAHVATNKLYAFVGDLSADHGNWGRPEQMNAARPSYYIDQTKPGADLAGETAAALAAASIVFAQVNKTYSDLCLSHAKDLYTFATQNLGEYSNQLPLNEADYYRSNGHGDELVWAAIWLYRATLNDLYFTAANKHFGDYNLGQWLGSDFSWEYKSLGAQLLLAKIGKDSYYIDSVKRYCDDKINQPKTPKGLAPITLFSGKGILGYVANAAFICLQVADMGINSQANRQFAQNQIHYMLGDTGRSFVAGFGTNPPVRMHHRSSSCPDMPATCDLNTLYQAAQNGQVLHGALAPGPDGNDNYADERSNWEGNEPVIIHNAGFQAAVAALQTLAAQRLFP